MLLSFLTKSVALVIFVEKFSLSSFKFFSSVNRFESDFFASSFISDSRAISLFIKLIWFIIFCRVFCAEDFSSSNFIFVIFKVCKVAAFSASSFFRSGILLAKCNWDLVCSATLICP